jgi:hypothetical protein
MDIESVRFEPARLPPRVEFHNGELYCEYAMMWLNMISSYASYRLPKTF